MTWFKRLRALVIVLVVLALVAGPAVPTDPQVEQAPASKTSQHRPAPPNATGETAATRFASNLRQDGVKQSTVLLSVGTVDRAALATLVNSLDGEILAELGNSWIDASLPVEKLADLLDSPLVADVIFPHPTRVPSPRVVPGFSTAQAADEGTNALDLALTGEALRVTGVPELHSAGISGRDVTIAIIDTGVDPGHQALRLTALGEPKLVDWVDFTGQGRPEQRASRGFGTLPAEGDVFTGFSSLPADGYIMTSRGRVRVEGAPSRSGVYHYGFIDAQQLGFDTRNVSSRQLIVVVTDPRTSGRYEQAYVDSDGDLDLADEKPLREFRDSRQVGWVGEPGGSQSRAFVITEIVSDGRMVNLGFDGNGHGTHVAGIAAANSAGFRGTAPGAKLMALKALGSEGEGSWDNISRAMIYAAENGANIINISIGALSRLQGTLEAENELIRQLTETYGVLVVVAAGNNGPGFGSISTPGDPAYALTVGAYMTPGLWESGYGVTVPAERVWYFSAVGPREDGTPGPTIVAPGIAYSTVPALVNPTGYMRLEGTSMAAAFVSGGAALLWHGARLQGREPEPLDIKNALELGARPLATARFAEQGYGAEQLGMAMEELASAIDQQLASVAPVLPITTRGPAGVENELQGLYMRGGSVGSQRFALTNTSANDLRLTLSAATPRIRPHVSSLRIPGDGTRQVQLQYRVGASLPGSVTETMFTGDDPGTFGPELGILHTFVEPSSFALPDAALTLAGRLQPAQLRRYFIEVPAGTEQLSFEVRVPGAEGEALGRVEVRAFGPDGREWTSSGVVGRPLQTTWSGTLSHPQPGTWEVTVRAPADLSRYQLSASSFELGISVQGIHLLPAAPLSGSATGQVRGTVELAAFGRTYSGKLLDVLDDGPNPSVVRQTIEVSSSQPFYEEFTLSRPAKLLELAAENTGDNPAPALYLYRYDENNNPQELATAEQGEGRLLVQELEPGRYLVWVESGVAGGITAQYRRTTATSSGKIDIGLRNVVLAPTFDLRFDVGVQAPTRRGRYRAYMILVDDDQTRVLGAFPVDVVVGDPSTVVQVLPVHDAQLDVTAMQVITTDRERKLPVEVPLKVNGATYQGQSAESGSVEVPIAVGATPIRLEHWDQLLGWMSYDVAIGSPLQVEATVEPDITRSKELRTKLRELINRQR